MFKKVVAKRWIILSAFIAFILGLVLFQQLMTKKEVSHGFYGTLLHDPRPIEPFKLMGTNNKVFNNDSFQNTWTFIFFGFTQCGSVCPTTMTELAKMYQILQAKQIKPLPQVVMISIDPERDQMTQLKHYVEAFNVDFKGARGSLVSVKKMTNEMGVAYVKVQSNQGSEHYDIQHSGTVMLINPQGQLSAFFTPPHTADLLAHDYQLLLNERKVN